MKGKKKTLVIEKPKAAQIKIYEDPITKLTPEITVDLSNPEGYISGIKALRNILFSNRDLYTVIPFKVISTYGHNTPEFLMHCYDLYIIGYRTSDEKFRVFEDTGTIDFPSLKYPGQTKYSFPSIIINDESTAPRSTSTRTILENNLKTIHTMGRIVAEAVRSYPISRYIKKLIAETNGEYFLDICKNVFGMEKLTLDLGTLERNAILQNVNGVLDLLTVLEISNTWGTSKTTGIPKIKALLERSFNNLISELQKVVIETKAIKLKLEELHSEIVYYQELLYSDEESEEEENDSLYGNSEIDLYVFREKIDNNIDETNAQLESTFIAMESPTNSLSSDEVAYDLTGQGCTLAYFEALKKSIDLYIINDNLEKAVDHIKTIYSNMRLPMEEAIGSIPKSENRTNPPNIPQGLYAESASHPGSYSKIPGSEKFNYQFSTSDDSPDDNSGSGAIAIFPKKNDDAKHSNIDWIEAIEQGDVKDYLLSLGIIQRMQEALAKMKNMLEKPTTIDFIIKRASEVATFSGCMLLLASSTTKDLSSIENKITLCSGFAALAGLTHYDNLAESGEILGQLIEIN